MLQNKIPCKTRVICLYAAMVSATVGLRSFGMGRPVAIAEKGVVKLPVIVGSQASPSIRESAETLVAMLSRMTGGEGTPPRDGDGRTGLVVGRPQDFTALPFEIDFAEGPFEREKYLLRSGPDGLWLLGATDLAVQHAVWDLLYRLGYRQYFPGEVWECVPRKPDLQLAVDRVENPDFYSRRIWYNWGMRWGYNVQPYRDWCARNRMAQGFKLNSGHAYGGIRGANRQAFNEHPEYYALVEGERRDRGGNSKFCIANPGLRQLVVEHACRVFEQHPERDSISMDPSDGGGWCECEDCVAMGSVSDRVLTLANEVAEAINQMGLGPKYVGMYAYNQHSPPPSINVHPKVIVSVATSFLRGGYTLDQIIEGWRERGATLGIYDYFSVIAWDWNLPRRARAARPTYIRDSLLKFHANGARFHDAESGDAWGPYGLGYYIASRLLWDLDESKRMDELIEEFIRTAFDSAADPMRDFYRLLTVDTARRSNVDLVARMYRHLNRAYALAAEVPEVLRRLDDLVKYTRYVELYDRFAESTGDARIVARDAVVSHAYRMRESMMVHSYGFWARTVKQAAAHQKDHPLKDERPIARDEILQWVRDGIERYQPVEMGFESKSFSGNLKPIPTPREASQAPRGNFPQMAQGRQRFHLWLNEPGVLELPVTVQKVWANRPHQIELYSPKEVSLEPVAVNTEVRPDGKTYPVRLTSPYPGLHRLEIRDGGDYTRVEWPEKMPVVIESGADTEGVGNHFRGEWTLFVYVPRGTTTIGGWAARVANWAPRVSGTLIDAAGEVRHDFGESGNGWFAVAVPEGQDGRFWTFKKNHGIRQLMTIPPYFASSPREMLLPSEVIDKDFTEADARK